MKVTVKMLEFAKRLNKENLFGMPGDQLCFRYIDDKNTGERSILVTDKKRNMDVDKMTTSDITILPNDSDSLIVAIFKARPDINVLLHTHSRHLNTISKTKKKLLPVLDDMAQILGPAVNSANGENGRKVLKYLIKRNVCLLHNDGAFVIGRDEQSVYTASLVLEKASTIFVYGYILGGSELIPLSHSVIMHLVYKKKYSQIDSKAKEIDLPDTKDPFEIKVRQEVKDSGMRLLANNLVQGTWGNTSIRLDKNHLVATPSGIDYQRLQPNQCAVVEIMDTSKWVGRLKPTSERKIHAAAMLQDKNVNAVIHSHPTYCGAFASVGAVLPAFKKEIQEQLGGDVRTAKYGLPGTKKLTKETIAGLEGRRAVFMKNHGTLVTGINMDDAFSNLKLLESSCREYLEIKASEMCKTETFDYNKYEELFVKNNS